MTDDLIARLRETWCGYYGMDERHLRNPDGDEAADRIEALSAEVERLREMLRLVDEWLKFAPLESGVCCCGDPIEGHGYYSGHSPVDAVQYSAMQLSDEIRAALEGTSDE